ncbi:hypothetical protein [Labilibaculum sp.]|uniref:hypothetical protein n=1 Tax=Labilibaculum sp. TaxID=2060723 RepID=UPI002AA795B1|nr:hypothetical protein [Labilibaculum sp.]
MSTKTRKISSIIIFFICFCSAIAFIIITSTTGVKSLDQIADIRSSITDIQAIRIKNSISYDLRLNGYKNKFKIAADYNEFFLIDLMAQKTNKSDTLIFEIDKKQIGQLNKSKTIQILGIKTDKQIFLDSKKTFETDKSTRRFLAPTGGVILILLSVGVYIYRRFYHKFDY